MNDDTGATTPHIYKSPALKHAGGRPTKVTPRMLRKAREYVKNWAESGKVVPSIEGLALRLGLHKDTIYSHEEFSDVIKDLQAIQGEILVNKGLEGKFNPMITKLILSSKHDYVERSKVESSNVNVELEIDPEASRDFATYLSSKLS